MVIKITPCSQELAAVEEMGAQSCQPVQSQCERAFMNTPKPKRGRPPRILIVEILLPFTKRIIIRADNVTNFWVVRCLE